MKALTRRGPGGGTRDLLKNTELHGNGKANNTRPARRGTCTCRMCCSVDIVVPARVRQVSQLAEFVSGRVEILGGGR